jgi:cytochrome c-type biogenesis protein CcmH
MRALVRRPYARSTILRGSIRAPLRWRSPHGLQPGCCWTSTLRFGLAWLLVALAALSVSAQPPATNAEDPRLYEIAAQLRCVVCQNLSVADSPSEMAQQMRVIIRERLAAGESPAQITQYFVDKYGEWILLSPRRSGFNLLLWGFPIAAIAVGLIVFALLLRRWTTRARATMTPSAVDGAVSEWIRRDLDSDQ